jgi:hypothetical protein
LTKLLKLGRFPAGGLICGVLQPPALDLEKSPAWKKGAKKPGLRLKNLWPQVLIA